MKVMTSHLNGLSLSEQTIIRTEVAIHSNMVMISVTCFRCPRASLHFSKQPTLQQRLRALKMNALESLALRVNLITPRLMENGLHKITQRKDSSFGVSFLNAKRN